MIARGKVSTVYEAVLSQTGKECALKVFNPSKASESKLKRFNLEGNILLRFQHPAIAKLYETGLCHSEEGDHIYHALELIHGLPLMEYIRSKRLLGRYRLELLLKICEAMTYVHKGGVLHRNLKPENILVEDSGQPKLIDFGLARLLFGQQAITGQGKIVGNLTYLSPEQVKGASDELDVRVDVYALGGIGYTMLAGRPPFDLKGKNLQESLEIILREAPAPLSSYSPTYAGDLERIFSQALSKNREERHATVAALAQDIQQHLDILKSLDTVSDVSPQ